MSMKKLHAHNLQTIYECVSKIDEQIFGMNVSINSQPYLGRATKQHVQLK